MRWIDALLARRPFNVVVAAVVNGPANPDLADDARDLFDRPAEASMFERLSLAASSWLPQNTYSGR